jgi:hypothetical protein
MSALAYGSAVLFLSFWLKFLPCGQKFQPPNKKYLAAAG